MGSTYDSTERDPAKWYWDADAWSTGQKVTFWMWFFAFCPVCLVLLGQEPEGRYRRLSWEERAQRRAAERDIRERMSRWIEAEPDLFRLEARPALASFLARHSGERRSRSRTTGRLEQRPPTRRPGVHARALETTSSKRP